MGVTSNTVTAEMILPIIGASDKHLEIPALLAMETVVHLAPWAFVMPRLCCSMS